MAIFFVCLPERYIPIPTSDDSLGFQPLDGEGKGYLFPMFEG